MSRTAVWFFAFLAVALGGLGWVSVTALALERGEAEARRRAGLEENVRLALWRMDTALAPFLAREGARTAAQMAAPPRYVRLYFRRGPDGQLSSDQTDDRLSKLEGILAAVPSSAWAPSSSSFGSMEYVARQKSVAAQQANFAAADRPDIQGSRPLFVGDELLLVRDDRGALVGAWLDWPEIQAWLCGEARDLLPGARLEPARGAAGTERLLASLPARLVPGDVPAPPGRGLAVGWILGVAWAGLLLAGAAIGGLLFGAMALSQRRAEFVSAVTHELRTPLTTFRTYTEMLAGGMVEPAKRQGYLDTLAREADRLGHLVENVLAYSRLEQNPVAPRAETLGVGELLDRLRPRLEERAAASGMTLDVRAAPDARVRADVSAVEQILFNLVDNACKYAGEAGEKIIHIEAGVAGGAVTLGVRDHGPGIPRRDRKRLFRPFQRSAERAAGSAPGVGLGLALCRRLARAMGGDLDIGRFGRGAVLCLTLPLA